MYESHDEMEDYEGCFVGCYYDRVTPLSDGTFAPDLDSLADMDGQNVAPAVLTEISSGVTPLLACSRTSSYPPTSS
jgi:hypothetical protein